MSATQLAYAVQSDEREFDISPSVMSVSLRRAIAGMTQHCESSHGKAHFVARGLVVDSLGDVEQQIIDFFPRRINVTPVLEEIAANVAASAAQSQQQFQELSFAYIGDGKPPKLEKANKQFLVKWFSVGSGRAVGSDFGQISQTLKPGYSAGAGGGGADILSQINFANEKGFVLIVGALDIQDARAAEAIMQAQMGGGSLPPKVIEAFGASPDTLAAVKAIMAAGGATAAAIEGLAQSVSGVKALQAAMNNAPDIETSKHMAAALNIQAEGMAAAMTPALTESLPAPVVRDMGVQIDNVKADLSASSTLALIDASARSPEAHGKAVENALHAVVDTAQTLGMSVSDMVQLAARQELPPAPQNQIDSFVESAGKAPSLAEHVAPARVDAQIISASLAEISKSSPLLEQVSQRLEAAVPMIDNGGAQVITQPLQVQSVADNLRAMEHSAYIPAEVKAELSVIVPQVEALAVQVRAEANAMAQPVMAPQNDNQVNVQANIQVNIQADMTTDVAQTAPVLPSSQPVQPVFEPQISAPALVSAQATILAPTLSQETQRLDSGVFNAGPTMPVSAPVMATAATVVEPNAAFPTQAKISVPDMGGNAVDGGAFANARAEVKAPAQDVRIKATADSIAKPADNVEGHEKTAFQAERTSFAQTMETQGKNKVIIGSEIKKPSKLKEDFGVCAGCGVSACSARGTGQCPVADFTVSRFSGPV